MSNQIIIEESEDESIATTQRSPPKLISIIKINTGRFYESDRLFNTEIGIKLRDIKDKELAIRHSNLRKSKA
jgi:hypothetical protein